MRLSSSLTTSIFWLMVSRARDAPSLPPVVFERLLVDCPDPGPSGEPFLRLIFLSRHLLQCCRCGAFRCRQPRCRRHREASRRMSPGNRGHHGLLAKRPAPGTVHLPRKACCAPTLEGLHQHVQQYAAVLYCTTVPLLVLGW